MSLCRPTPFLSSAAKLLRGADIVYLDTGAIDAAGASHIRTRFAQTLRERPVWDRFARDRSASVEMHVGDTVSAFFFHTYHGGFAPPDCYIFRHQIEKARAVLPTLQALASEAPTILIATEAMTLLEVAPEAEQLPFAISIAQAWTRSRPGDTAFWVDYGIGRKFCDWLEAMRQKAPSAFQTGSPFRSEIDQLLAALVRVGVPEAGRLEGQLIGT